MAPCCVFDMVSPAVGKWVPAVLIALLVISRVSQAQESGFGSYVCKNLVTNETVTSGIFPDHTFAPFSAPLDPDDYGLRYYNNIECNFELVAPVEMYVYIEFARLSLDEPCTGDFITLSLIGEQERTLCGEPQGLVYDVFESNRAHVIFRSDEAITAEGFSAFFKAFNPAFEDPAGGSQMQVREPEPSGKDPRHHGSRSNAWLLNKRTSTQYLHQYRFENRHKGRSALPLHNTTAIRQILQTRQAEEFSDQVEKQKTRLEHALAVRESYDKDVLKFMRFAALAVDMARYCGNTCTKTTSDVLKVCREFKGYL